MSARGEGTAVAAGSGPVYVSLGDCAVLVRFGERIETKWIESVRATADRLEARPFPGFVEAVPSFAALAVHYDPLQVYREWKRRYGGEEDDAASVHEIVCEWVRATLADMPEVAEGEGRTVTIPVCYGGEFGPDLAELASEKGLEPEEAAKLHAQAEYRVAMIGFAPGFPYLVGLPERLSAPRRATPRSAVPAGSVGIAGAQTGLYPLQTPGGWNLIGRTPLRLFRPHDDPPSLLKAGDRVRFEAISPERFAELAAAEEAEAARLAGAASPDGAEPSPHGSVVVERPGLLATVQDGGRPGRQRYGVSVGGAMDGFALRAANALVGNAPEAAALELTLAGSAFAFAADALIAVAGGGSAPTVGGAPLPRWRAVFVRRGSRLAFAPAPDASGCRAYLAVAGGFAVPAVLGSRGTHLAARLGGFAGRPLRAGDALPLGAPSAAAKALLAALRRLAGDAAWAAAPWGVSPYALPPYDDHPVVRVTPGPEYDRFAQDSLRLFAQSDYAVSPRSDRMGYRLDGPPLACEGAGVMLSEPVAAGTVQVPPDGCPVVLMADRQTTGGYPRIAQVAEADLPVLAQLRPGARVRFMWIGIDESQELLLAQRLEIERLRAGIALRLTEGMKAR